MPRLCALKCLPMSVMLFLASYTLTVTSPHPGTQKRSTYPVRLGFVVPRNTMANSCCFNTGFVGNEKTWPGWLPANLGSASLKPLFSTCQKKVMNKSSPELSYSTDKKGHSVFLHVVTGRLAKEEEVPLGTGS